MRNLELRRAVAVYDERCVRPVLPVMMASNLEWWLFYTMEDRLYGFSETDRVSVKFEDFNLIDMADVELIQDSMFILSRSGVVLEACLPVQQQLQLTRHTVADCNMDRMFWSPDSSRVIFVNSTDNVAIISSYYFEELARINISEDVQIKRVTVGWGQKATQFKGYKNKKEQRETVEDCLDSSIHVTWRQDSLRFAVSFVRDKVRRVKVFTRDGVLQHITEDDLNLDGPMAWMPSMGFLAVGQLGGSRICFLEQNALYFKHLDLPDSHRVIGLYWNTTSDILAAHCSVLQEDATECILLWVTSNSKWYLKQRLVFKAPTKLVYWNRSVPNRLHVFSHTGVCRTYEWLWKYNTSHACYCTKYNGFIASVDGNFCNLTPLNKTLLPPPMFAERVELQHFSNGVIFPEGECGGFLVDCNSFASIASTIAIFNYVGDAFEKMGSYQIKVEANGVVEDFVPDVELYNWFWEFPYTFYFAWSGRRGNFVGIAKYTPESDMVMLKGLIPVKSAVSLIAGSRDKVVVSCLDGSCFLISEDKSECFEMDMPQFRELPVKVQLTQAGLLSLGVDGYLYINDRLVSSNVADFAWSRPFLVAMTLDFVIQMYKLPSDIDSWQLNTSMMYQFLSRKAETGIRLVALIGSSLILQHERGNLEVVVPRAFALSYLHWLLKKKAFAIAFYFLRKLRINTNMLFDHNPREFIRNADSFVEDKLILSDFIADLSDKCHVTETYWDYYNNYPRYKVDNKLTLVCSLLIKAMSPQKEHFVMEILHCQVKSHKLQEALQLASENNLLSYVLKLMNGRSLFQAALSCYRLDLALTIAKMAQLDPKDYQSTLEKLTTLNENRRRFLINEMAGNYKEALKYLLLDDADECLNFIRQHDLYSFALRQSKGTDKYDHVVNVYADHLKSSNSYDEAAVMYETVENYSQAITCYQLAGKWKSVLSLVRKMNYPESDSNHLAESLITQYCSVNKYSLAAEVANFWLHDLNRSVAFWLSANDFDQAQNLALGRADLLEQVRTSVTAEYARLWRVIGMHVETILKYCTRLKIIQESKSKRDEIGEDDFEDLSKESSIAFSRSSRTGSTSRTEKRLWNLKEGNPREEMALYKHLHSIMKELNELSDEVRKVCLATMRLKELTQAASLQKHMKTAMEVMEESKSLIWSCTNVKGDGTYEDVVVRCQPHIPIKSAWEIPLLNNYDSTN